MNERMRFDPAEAHKAGCTDGMNLIAELNNIRGKNTAESLFMQSLSEVVGLAVESRLPEAHARLSGFCGVVGALLNDAANRLPALEAKCTLLSASLNQMDNENDKLRHAVTDSEGGEL